MNKPLQVLKYVISDFLSAGIAWTLFYLYRKKFLEPIKFGHPVSIELDDKFYLGLLIIPLCWLLLYTMMGNYRNIYRKHRLRELGQTLLATIIGVLILFFTVLLDDEIAQYQFYYHSILSLFTLHFVITFAFRFILTSRTVKRIHRRDIGFNTLVVGGNEEAVEAVKEIREMKNSPGFLFVGYVSVNGRDRLLADYDIPHLGNFRDVGKYISEYKVEEIIIAIDSTEHKNLGHIITSLEGYNVNIKVIPDMYDLLSGSVKMTSIFGAPLIAINPEIMPAWQVSLKRITDIVASLIAVIILSPVYIVLGILVKATSPGPVIFKQLRIGQHGRPFYIYKFRTMCHNAEQNGPQLSSSTDSRITPIGRFLRKTRLDEIPQFFNVLKGEMSLVGPRPERQYFIDQIVCRAPHYRHLHKVKPGITSWGQVKYGYAENVDQMIHRMKYDILYIENMSIAVDLKIMAYTMLTILKGSGK